MKVTVEVDCTPEEARGFLGLPDVVPIQQAIAPDHSSGLRHAPPGFGQVRQRRRCAHPPTPGGLARLLGSGHLP
jgi:hypothetical protein